MNTDKETTQKVRDGKCPAKRPVVVLLPMQHGDTHMRTETQYKQCILDMDHTDSFHFDGGYAWNNDYAANLTP